MKTALTHGTASIALIASLIGTAHAAEQNEAEFIGPVLEFVDDEVTYNIEEVEQKRDAEHASFVAVPAFDRPSYTSPALDPVAVPTELLANYNRAETSLTIAQIPTASNSAPAQADGLVTLRSIDAQTGDVDPFYGTINPFYGNIDAFWGTINPFYGTINPFWGDINPFWGDINPFYGDISPFYGDISPFWGDIRPFYGDIVAFEKQVASLGEFWSSHSQTIDLVETRFNQITYNPDGSIVRDGSPNRMMDALGAMIAEGKAKFGTAYTSKTGKSFDSLVNEVFARYGANPNDKKSVEVLTVRERARLYLDWHDTLNQYSGVDAVDHWMPAINWTPSITQIQSDGYDSIIGVIDSNFGSNPDLLDNLVHYRGSSNLVGGHGAAVASLIFGEHDGEGVMGIAPNARVSAYNPYDSNGNADWDDIIHAILELKEDQTSWYDRVFRGAKSTSASVINLSLGESGWVFAPGLESVLDHWKVNNYHDETVYVFAAGNEGISQTQDVEFRDADEVAMIFVGSINPLGEISSFSNRPGSACLTRYGRCETENKLYMRTVVAPGEMILVADGQGGVTRMSGTSFAAPLVSGAVTLLHSRWPWLKDRPQETTEIIFRSARDLGAPGPDEVYGWGLLDVTASQSPLDFNALSYHLYKKNGKSWSGQSVSASTLLAGGLPAHWQTNAVFFTGFEKIGRTQRDFLIPASTFTKGKKTGALGRGMERFQDYVQNRFANWIKSGGSDRDGDGMPGFTELNSNGTELNGDWALRYDAIAPQFDQDGALRMVHSAATLIEPSGKASFTLGHGQGAMALTGYQFGVMSDYDHQTGGANPVLGLASGESFMQLGYHLTGNTKVSVGYTENREKWDEVGEIDPLELQARQRLGDRPASAFTLDIEQRVNERITVGAQYTRLNEVNALLGTQTATSALLGGGSQTDALTLSASVDVGSGLSFDVAATAARTETSQDQFLTNAGAVLSSAGQFTATKRGIFNGEDTLRISVAQPLQVEQGSLQVTMDEVIDRETGEIGPVTQTFSIATERRITTEAVYALPLTKSSEFSAFGRYVSAGDTFDEAGLVVGGNFSIRF